MIELLYAIIGASLFCSIFKFSKSIFCNEQNKNYVYDDRDTDEKIIAGEDTSEVALNYLKKL